MGKKNRVVDFDIASSCHIERLSFFENVYFYFLHSSKPGHYLFLNIDGRITFRVHRRFGAKTRAVCFESRCMYKKIFLRMLPQKKKNFNCALGSNLITPFTLFSNLININRKYYLPPPAGIV